MVGSTSSLSLMRIQVTTRDGILDTNSSEITTPFCWKSCSMIRRWGWYSSAKYRRLFVAGSVQSRSCLEGLKERADVMCSQEERGKARIHLLLFRSLPRWP